MSLGTSTIETPNMASTPSAQKAITPGLTMVSLCTPMMLLISEAGRNRRNTSLFIAFAFSSLTRLICRHR